MPTALKFQPWPKELVEDAYYHQGRRPTCNAARHRRPLRDHRRPAGHAGRAGQAGRSRLPRRGARAGHARRHRPGFGAERRRRLRLPGRPRRPGADPDGRRRRRRPAAQGLRDDPAQPARARHRPAHRQAASTTSGKTVVTHLLDRHARGDAEDRREDRGRADASARSRCRCARSPTIPAELERAIATGEVKVPEGDDPKAEKAMLRRVAARPIETATPTFATGADVSRFQRRTVPGKPPDGRGRAARRLQPAAALSRCGAAPVAGPGRRASPAATPSPSFRSGGSN